MVWTYLGIKKLPSYEIYKKELLDRLNSAQAEDEDIAQKLLNENDAWEECNEAIAVLESSARDPRDRLKIYREGRKHYHKIFIFKSGPFTIAYLRDPLAQKAIPITFFHHRDRQKRLAELANLLEASDESPERNS